MSFSNFISQKNENIRSFSNWNDFLERMRIEIGKNIQQATTEWLTLDFSTTTKIESLLLYKAIMDTFQNYFEYECYTIRYTIHNVHLMR